MLLFSITQDTYTIAREMVQLNDEYGILAEYGIVRKNSNGD